jgi:hypothetical protein
VGVVAKRLSKSLGAGAGYKANEASLVLQMSHPSPLLPKPAHLHSSV